MTMVTFPFNLTLDPVFVFSPPVSSSVLVLTGSSSSVLVASSVLGVFVACNFPSITRSASTMSMFIQQLEEHLNFNGAQHMDSKMQRRRMRYCFVRMAGAHCTARTLISVLAVSIDGQTPRLKSHQRKRANAVFLTMLQKEQERRSFLLC